MEKVSIIVPIYNAENYIKRCCSSILEQTYENLEVLLIDDGSVDNSSQICDQIAADDSRVKVIHTINQGVSGARNTGIKNASGDWLMFIDADDWIDKYTVEKLLELVIKNKAELGIYGFVFEYENDKVVHRVENIDCSVKELLEMVENLRTRDSIFCSVCNKIYKRNVIQDHNIFFDKKLKFGEDFIFNTRYYAQIENVVTDSKLFYHYDCSVNNSGVKKLYSNYDYFILKMEEGLKKLLIQCGVSEERGKAFYLNFIMERWDYAFCICIESNISFKEKVEYLHRWSQEKGQEMWVLSLKRNNTLSKFARLFSYDKHSSKPAVIKALIQITLNKRILFVKQTVRRVLVK